MKAKELKNTTNNQQNKPKPIILTAKAAKNLPIKRSGGCCGR